jgi:hypothetical protein
MNQKDLLAAQSSITQGSWRITVQGEGCLQPDLGYQGIQHGTGARCALPCSMWLTTN